MGFSHDARLPSSTGGPCEGEQENDPGQWADLISGQERGSTYIYLVLIAFSAGGCGGDKLDTGAIAPRASTATSTEAGTPQDRTQAVSTTGGEGVATAPTKTQASTSDATATTIATGNCGGDHSCRKRGDMVRIKARKEITWGPGVSGPVP